MEIIEIDGNEKLIDVLRKEVQNGGFKTRESIREAAAQYNGRVGSRNRSGADDARREGTRGNGSLVGRVRTDNGRGNIAQSDRNKTTKYSLNVYDSDAESLTPERKKEIFEQWERDHAERQNWENSNNIIAYENDEQFENFVEKVLKNEDTHKMKIWKSQEVKNQ